jgi:hypothetical protein
MPASDPKDDLRHYLQLAREAVLWKLDGLSDYDVRRPVVPTGTNLLGLVKHVAGVEAGYLGDTRCGSTPTRRSTRCRSMPPATFHGGRRVAVR